MPELKEFHDYKPIGFLTEETLAWLSDPNGIGPATFVPNRNGGQVGIYSGEDFYQLHLAAQRLKAEIVEYTLGERAHLLRCKSIVKDLLAWYDDGQRTMKQLDRIHDVAADLVPR